MSDKPSPGDGLLGPEVRGYYAAGKEDDRLFVGHGQLERVRTQEILTRYLPRPPARILDAGGGWGVYAFWLAGQGYEVHLVDPVPEHIEQARQRQPQEGEGQLASARVGDARQLEFAAESADVVLLFGPLYHLTGRDDRIQALREAARVLRPGGFVFAVGISRFASLFDGLSHGFIEDPEFQKIVERDLKDGQHRNPTNQPGYFTTAFFHHPDELRDEVREAGFISIDLLGIEGPGRGRVDDFDAWWSDPARREHLLAAARAVEREPTLLGLGPHVMAIGRKEPLVE